MSMTIKDIKKDSKNFTWGEVIRIHEIGDIAIVEYQVKPGHTDSGEIHFHNFVKGRDTNHSCDSLDFAILEGLGYKWGGPNSQFSQMASRMLEMDNNDPYIIRWLRKYAPEELEGDE